MSDIWRWAIIIFLLIWALLDVRDYVHSRENRGSRESDRSFWNDDDTGGGE